MIGVIDHTDAPRLSPKAGGFFGPDGNLQLLQDAAIPFAGRPIALVIPRPRSRPKRPPPP
ncbi:hypothetical protein [Nonomuraea sp. NPDC003804]|uniref:hypothetical protein n=1 Tax=Nonomuraea sp. NPDC003804 TaxID=3154547 RepID=UPI0033A5917D